MNSPSSYYQKHLEMYQTEAKRLYKNMTALSLYRLLVFIMAGIGIYTLFEYWKLAVTIPVCGIVAFLFLLSIYNDVKAKKQFNEALVNINKDEISIASGDFHKRETGLQYQDPNHFYSLDIDLFGRGSFFQFINRTD